MKTKLAIFSAFLLSTSSFAYAKDLAEEKDIKCFALYDVATYFHNVIGEDYNKYPWMMKIFAVHSSMEKRVNEKYVAKMGVEQGTVKAAFVRAKKSYLANRLSPILTTGSEEDQRVNGMKRLKVDIDALSCK